LATTRSRRPRIADVAREAGVSKTAVSFAFNNPDRLSPETAERIRGVAESLGYQPHPVARMLAQQRTSTLGVLTPQPLSVVLENPFFSLFSSGAALAAGRLGYSLQLISPFHGSLARAVARATIDGVIVVGLWADHPEVEQIHQAGLPMVLVDSSALPHHSSVMVDDEGGARVAAEHLAGLGHRDVLVIAIEPPQPAGLGDTEGIVGQRLRGYRAGLQSAGVVLADEAVIASPVTIDGGRAALMQAWEDGLRPTGVLAMGDVMAIGALQAARDLRIEVPRMMSIVGFDDIEFAAYTDPPLTTVHQPVRRKGELAVEILVAEIEDEAPDRPVHSCLEARLIPRASSGPAPSNTGEVRGVAI
jgi:DNA-binding LacI/PurR family transcriptional regulator